MSWNRDIRLVIAVSIVGMAMMLFASFSANQRITQWQTEFATSSEDYVYQASMLLLEHHRLIDAMTAYARNDDLTDKGELLERLDIYWSRHELIKSRGHIFKASKMTESLDWLPADAHSDILVDTLAQIQLKAGPVLRGVEQQIRILKPDDPHGFLAAQWQLDSISELLSTLQIVSFEKKRYLNQVQVALSEQLKNQLRNAFLGISAGVILLSYLFMMYMRERYRATKNLKEVNRQLRHEARESERLSQQLSFHARHDGLSGLINRFGFNEELSSILATSKGSHGLCFIDLDMFKVVNDTCGHKAGDELIKETARLLLQALPEHAVVARFGGDEYVILLKDCVQSEFENYITDCCSNLKRYVFTHGANQFDISGSFGAAFFNAGDAHLQTLLSAVDAACYEAKRAGGARVHFYREDDDDDDDIVELRRHDLDCVAKIQNALSDNGFCLLRQPIMALHDAELTGRPDHWEVLLRMVGLNQEMISPGDFLDIAERYALSPRIDRWVIEQTFEWLNAMFEADGHAEFVNINLSGVSIGDEDFLKHIEKLTLTLNIPTSNVCFEITETSVVGKHAREFLIRLKELGYQLALDDFGIGFSSFGYLESLPVDYIKIDGLFVRDIECNSIHREFVRSINDIGKLMGKQTIAEYVENQESLSVLKSIGVDFAQGYHIAKPSPISMPVSAQYPDRISA